MGNPAVLKSAATRKTKARVDPGLVSEAPAALRADIKDTSRKNARIGVVEAAAFGGRLLTFTETPVGCRAKEVRATREQAHDVSSLEPRLV